VQLLLPPDRLQFAQIIDQARHSKQAASTAGTCETVTDRKRF